MREILFRGQTRQKGEKVRMDGSPVDSNWVYGGILPGKGDHSIIYQTEPELEKFPVYTDTVGQYTGLKDKNGTRIFEGDIVEHERHMHIVAYNDEYAGFWPFYDQDHPAGYGVIGEESEVIGNIHDNPELLEGGTQ